MVRAFPEKPDCTVPSIPAIDAADYFFDSCNIPDIPASLPFRQTPLFNNPVPLSPVLVGRTENSIRQDYLVNGNFAIWTRGSVIDASTYFDNSSREFGPDQWRIESDGDDIVDLERSSISEIGNATGVCIMTVATANKKFGLSQAIEGRRLGGAEGKPLTFAFDAATIGATIGHLRAVILGFDGCIAPDDTDNYPIVSAWNAAGVDPTWDTGWTPLSTPANLADLGAGWQRFSVTADAAAVTNFANIAVMLWVDDTSIDVGDVLLVKKAQLENRANATPFRYRGIGEDLALCQRYGNKTFNQQTAPVEGIGDYTSALLAFGVTGGKWGIQWQLPTTLWRIPEADELFTFNPISANAYARNMSDGADTGVDAIYYSDTRISFLGGDTSDAGDEILLNAAIFPRL